MRLPAFQITKRALNIIILIFVVELLLLAFLVYRQQTVIGGLEKEKREREEDIVRYAKTYRELPQLEESLNSLRSQLGAVDWELPSPAYIPTFLAQIEQWARQCGVKLTNITPQQQAPAPAKSTPKAAAEEEAGVKRGEYREQAKPEEKQPAASYETISLSLQAEGSFTAVQRFIDGFRRFPKALSLSKLDITPQEREGEAPLLRVSLSLNIAVLSGGMRK